MTTQAVFLEVSRDLLMGCVGLEECPAPSVIPKGVVGKPIVRFCIESLVMFPLVPTSAAAV
jgi:hypothetical protein